jgi:hypothetical protein
MKITYDPRVRYTTFLYDITPALAERIPIPGGYYDSTAIYGCFPDPKVDRRGIVTMKCEGDKRMSLTYSF